MGILWDSNQITTTNMKTKDNIKTLLRAAIVAELKARQEEIDINIEGSVADILTGSDCFCVWLECRKMKQSGLIAISADRLEQIRATGAKYILIHSERGKVGYWVEIGKEMNFCAWARTATDEFNEEVMVYELLHPYSA